MRSGEEHAAGPRVGTFPASWGTPEGRSDSEERAAWVLRNVATDQGLKRRGLDPVEVRTGKRQVMSGAAALAKVQRIAGTVPLDTGLPVKNLSRAELLALIDQILADLKIASGELP